MDPVKIASLYLFEITGCPLYECKWDDLPSTDAKGKKAFTSDPKSLKMYFDPSQADIANIGMAATKVKIACRVEANSTFVEADNKFEIESGKKCDGSLGNAASKPTIANKPYGGDGSTYDLYDAALVKHSTPFGFRTLMGFSVKDTVGCAWNFGSCQFLKKDGKTTLLSSDKALKFGDFKAGEASFKMSLATDQKDGYSTDFTIKCSDGAQTHVSPVYSFTQAPKCESSAYAEWDDSTFNSESAKIKKTITANYKATVSPPTVTAAFVPKDADCPVTKYEIWDKAGAKKLTNTAVSIDTKGKLTITSNAANGDKVEFSVAAFLGEGGAESSKVLSGFVYTQNDECFNAAVKNTAPAYFEASP